MQILAQFSSLSMRAANLPSRIQLNSELQLDAAEMYGNAPHVRVTRALAYFA